MGNRSGLSETEKSQPFMDLDKAPGKSTKETDSLDQMARNRTERGRSGRFPWLEQPREKTRKRGSKTHLIRR